MSTDERIAAYIAKAAPFARPILEHVRTLVHAAVPEATETIKWGMPFFECQRRPLAMMAAFKGHAGLGILDGSPMGKSEGMGQFGKLTSVADLPDDTVLTDRLRVAATLAAAGKPAMRPRAAPKPALAMPDDLAAALAAVPAAKSGFAALTPGAQREYLEWVLGAKQAATRNKRLATIVNQVAEGKKLNWRYENC
jgi:hypothetical protein